MTTDEGGAMTPAYAKAFVAALLLMVLPSACVVRGGPPWPLFFAVTETAILTAAVVSATEPPPSRLVYVPEAPPGYVWQPGYWTLRNGSWLWIEGGWVALRPGRGWAPTHWEHLPDGRWQLVQGHWVPVPPAS